MRLENFLTEDLRLFQGKIEERYMGFCQKNLQLDLTRGKPSSEQLSLSDRLWTSVHPSEYVRPSGADYRNYGELLGILEARSLFAEYLQSMIEKTLVGNNSSLRLMHDVILFALHHGMHNSEKPWGKQKIKFLCPSPGYDRHFAVCEHYGIEMISIDMNDYGPDMVEVERLLQSDEQIKGIWCVPKYSNPTGIVYDEKIILRLAQMETAAKDFCLFWDNAYQEHHLTEEEEQLPSLVEASLRSDYPDRAWVFGSTSKITFAGGGLSFLTTSSENFRWLTGHLSRQNIGPNKLNQLCHVRFLRNLEGIRGHMRRHRRLIYPKFSAVQEILHRELRSYGVAEWTHPKGGYFVSLDTLPGCAKNTVELAATAGVKLTPAGATYPYGRDPRDCNIRLAPTYPNLDEVKLAMEGVSLSILKVSIACLLTHR